MRADLNKLLCERERRGGMYRSFGPYRKAKKFAVEIDTEEGGDAGHESMTRRYGYDGKEFNENLNPLRRQLQKAIGRRWDAFYSELCRVFDKRSVINQHILQHLYDYCERNVYLRDKELWVRGKYGHDKPLKNESCDFYVDPRDGLIKANSFRVSYRTEQRKERAREAKEEAQRTRWIDDERVLRKVAGIWFIFDVRPLPETGFVFDRFRMDWIEKQRWGWASKTYHWRRRTASHKLLKQLGVIKS